MTGYDDAATVEGTSPGRPALQLFNVSGVQIRFGTTGDGTPYVVASDFAKTMGYRDAEKATRLLDEDEKGTQIVGTPGGPQEMSVIYEDGMWELIFRSTLPGARNIKKRVKAILREIRETGSYSVAVPRTLPEALRAYALEVEQHEVTRQRVAELEPAAGAWEALAEAEGDYSVREAAQILNRDPAISTGQNRLFATLRDIGWVDASGQPYQREVDNGRLRRRTTSYSHPHHGEPVLSSQVRITAKGVAALRDWLGGQQEALPLDETSPPPSSN